MTQADFEITLLAWRLGGPALLLPLQKRLGLAGLRTIKGLDNVKFRISSQGWDGKDATANVTAMLVGGCRPRVAMLDEIAVVPAPRYAAKDNSLAVLCWQHTKLQNLTIRLWKAVGCMRRRRPLSSQLVPWAPPATLHGLWLPCHTARLVWQLTSSISCSFLHCKTSSAQAIRGAPGACAGPGGQAQRTRPVCTFQPA
jgi:hypothetical protein